MIVTRFRMSMRFTAVFEQVPEGRIGFVEELRGANTQGATLEAAWAKDKCGDCPAPLGP
jgi:hypothetical protein